MGNLAPRDGEIYLFREFFKPPESDRYFAALLEDLAWQEEEITIAGKKIKVPRLMCWYGDKDAVYKYSGVVHVPLPWTDVLLDIRQRVERECSRPFNSVLANLYRDGSDSMGWHADKEKELGKNPLIASLSLGEARLFKIRHNKTKETLDLLLQHGDLLVMAGTLQHHWRHSLPKVARKLGKRINLTFRTILA